MQMRSRRLNLPKALAGINNHEGWHQKGPGHWRVPATGPDDQFLGTGRNIGSDTVSIRDLSC